MLQSLKPFHCPGCGYSFTCKETRQHGISRYPLIVACGHTFCENCLRNIAKKEPIFSCSACQKVTHFEQGEATIVKFPPDIYVLGVLGANHKQSLPSLKTKMSSPTIKVKKSDIHVKPLIVCDQCSQTLAKWKCKICGPNYCSTCFDTTHRVEAMKNHGGQQITVAGKSMVQEGCLEHKGRAIEYYCEDDNKLTCGHCNVQAHQGHLVVDLQQKNQSSFDELKEVLEEASLHRRRLIHTEQKLRDAFPTENSDVCQIVKDVHEKFHSMHVALQMRELAVVSALEEISRCNVTPLDRMLQEVSDYERDIASLIKDAECVLKHPHLSISVPTLIRSLNECKTLPCHLVPIETNNDPTSGVHISFELEDYLAIVKKIGNVTINLKPKFSLTATNELPDGFVIDELEDELDSADTESVSSKAESLPEEKKINMILSSKNTAIQSLMQFKEFSKHDERVLVSHIISPSSFWVQRASETKKVKCLTESISRWCRMESVKHKPSSVDKGDLYLVYCSDDRNWYRGRVLEIVDPSEGSGIIGKKFPVIDEDGTITTVSKEIQVRVILVDFGRSLLIPISKLCSMQQRFLSLPTMSRHCSLSDILPIEEDKWSPEALDTFVKFVAKRPVLMKVIEEVNSILYVDLCQDAASDITNDTPVSVRDAMVFMDHGQFPPGSNHKLSKPKKVLRHFLPPEVLRTNVNFQAVISHVENPSRFYIQQICTARYLSELIFEMQKAYSNNINNMLYSIYVPYKGMICAVQYSVDKKWYRAEVLNLCGDGMVEVSYIDFGNTEITHFKHLRKISDRFCKLPAQATMCCFADIECEGEEWAAEAKEWLKTAGVKRLSVKCLGYLPEPKRANVVMYDVEDYYEYCVNALLVKNGYAESTGPFSTMVKIPREMPEITYQPPAHFLMPKSIPVSKRNGVLFDEHELESEAEAKPAKLINANIPDDHINVYMTFVQHPHCIYVRRVDQEEKLQKLTEEMNKVYGSFKGKSCLLSQGEQCAVKYQKQWHRAKVVQVVLEDHVEVFFLDIGRTETLQASEVYPLLENFWVPAPSLIKCKLYDVMPVSGQKWSFVTCKELEKLILAQEALYIIHKGECDQNTGAYPCEIYHQQLIRGSALEPTRYILKNISDIVCEQGICVRSKNNRIPSPIEKSSSGPVKILSRNDSASNHSLSNAIPVTKDIPTNSPSTSTEANINTVIIPPVPSIPKRQWKPCVFPDEKTFEACVTNIGEDCSIHLHITKKGFSKVQMIKTALQCTLRNQKENAPTIPPPVGEACIAKYVVDTMWYRAEILSHHGPKLKVVFVDYGNIEIVSLEAIRCDIFMENFEKQCIECKLVNIKPVGGKAWSESAINFLHGTIVEQQCTAQVEGPVENGRLPITLTLTGPGYDISTVMIDMGYAVPSDSMPQIKAFKKATPFREGEAFPVYVTNVKSPDIVCLQHLKVKNPESDHDKEWNKELAEFLDLVVDLSEKADNFPVIKQPFPGMVCCAKYSYDNNWYRCEITDVTEKGPCVFYVDYGNTEIVSAENMREPADWVFEVPVQLHLCKLHALKSLLEEGDLDFQDQLVDKFSNTNQKIYAKVAVPGDIAEVDLFVMNENGDLTLAYKDLLESNLEEKDVDKSDVPKVADVQPL